MVNNIHSRTVAAPATTAGALLDSLSGPDDCLWPRRSWPAMVFDRPLGLGAVGGHGPIRYTVEAYEPGSSVRFRFDPRIGLDGTHEFTVTTPTLGRVELRHTLTGRTSGVMRLGWPLVFRPLHDALVEDALDNAERQLTGTVVRPARWSLRVRLLRRLVRRGRVRPDVGRRRSPRGLRRAPAVPVAGSEPLLPRATFHSSHQRWVDAPPEVVRQAAADLTVDELRLARGLMAVRRLPASVASLVLRHGAETRPARPGQREPTRFLDAFTRLGFVRLAEDGDHLAAGAVARFWQLRPGLAAGVVDAASFAAFDEPGWAKAATTLAVAAAPDGRGSILATTTAVETTDEAARRAFARYWTMISLPSGLIRREWLAAIAHRAEALPADRQPASGRA